MCGQRTPDYKCSMSRGDLCPECYDDDVDGRKCSGCNVRTDDLGVCRSIGSGFRWICAECRCEEGCEDCARFKGPSNQKSSLLPSRKPQTALKMKLWQQLVAEYPSVNKATAVNALMQCSHKKGAEQKKAATLLLFPLGYVPPYVPSLPRVPQPGPVKREGGGVKRVGEGVKREGNVLK